MNALLDLAGLAGVATYLLSYAALQAGVIRGNGYLYPGLNLLAACLVLASLASSFNLSSALIQVSWIAISLFGITRLYLLTQRSKFTEDEAALLKRHLPGLPRHTARKFLDAGAWRTLPAGTSIVREGATLGKLIFLHLGAATVSIRDRTIATLAGGDLIGEMTVLDGTPATADVVVSADAQVFEISAEALSRVMRADSETHVLLEANLSRDLRKKLSAANQRSMH